MANRGISEDLKSRVDRFIQNSSNERVKYSGYTISETSYLGLRPGDLIQFKYGYGPRSTRYGIILSSGRASSGLFLSRLLNSLYNVLVCEGLEEGMFLSLLNTMYGKESKATYSMAKSVAALETSPSTGKPYVKDFRTLNVSTLFDILKVELVKER